MVEQKKDRITKTTEPLTKKEIDTIWRRFYNAYGVAGSFDAL